MINIEMTVKTSAIAPIVFDFESACLKYFIAGIRPKGGRKKESNRGFLRVKVAQSSMLARQIAGWIEGFKKINNFVYFTNYSGSCLYKYFFPILNKVFFYMVPALKGIGKPFFYS